MQKNILVHRIINLIVCAGVFLAHLSVFAGGANALSGGGIIAISNNQRVSAGLPALAYNAQLTAAANAKAAHMCTLNYWDHTAPDGTTGWTFISQAGYVYIRAGENLAKGFGDDQSVVDGWMASAGHRANILQPAFVDTGVGSYQCGSTIYDTIVVAMYAVRNVPAPAPAPKPAPTAQVAPKPAPTPVQITKIAQAPIDQATTLEVPVEQKEVAKPVPVKKESLLHVAIVHELEDDKYSEDISAFLNLEFVLNY